MSVSRGRGGKRTGAGAPKGNLNATRSGHYSPRLRTVAKALSAIPEIRDLLLEAHRRQQKSQRKAERIAFKALKDLLSTFPDPNNLLFPYMPNEISDTDPRNN